MVSNVECDSRSRIPISSQEHDHRYVGYHRPDRLERRVVNWRFDVDGDKEMVVKMEEMMLLLTMIWTLCHGNYFQYNSPRGLVFKLPLHSRFASQIGACGDVESRVAEHILLIFNHSFRSFVDMSPEEGILYCMLLSAASEKGVALLIDQDDSYQFLSVNIQSSVVQNNKSIETILKPIDEASLQHSINLYHNIFQESLHQIPSSCPDFVISRFLLSRHVSDLWLLFNNYEPILGRCKAAVLFDSNSLPALEALGNILSSFDYSVSLQILCDHCHQTSRASHRMLLTGVYNPVNIVAEYCDSHSQGTERLNCLLQRFSRQRHFFQDSLRAKEMESKESLTTAQCEWHSDLVESRQTILLPFDALVLPSFPVWTCLLEYLRFHKIDSEEILDMEIHMLYRDKSNLSFNVFLANAHCISWLRSLAVLFEKLLSSSQVGSDIFLFCPNYSTKEQMLQDGLRTSSMVAQCYRYVLTEMKWHYELFEKKFGATVIYRQQLLDSLAKHDNNSIEFQSISAMTKEDMFRPATFIDPVHSDLSMRPYALYFDQNLLSIISPWEYISSSSKEGSHLPWDELVRKFQQKLQDWQNPPVLPPAYQPYARTCSTSKYLVYEPLSHFHGIGAIVEQILAAMQYSLCMNRIFVLATKVNGTLAKYSSGCHEEANPFVCYMEPLTSCHISEEDIRQAPPASTSGEGFDKEPYLSERVLVLRGLPEKGFCAKISLSLPSESLIFQTNLERGQLLESTMKSNASRWKESWYTHTMYPLRLQARTSPVFEQYAFERQRQLSLLLPYLLRPKRLFQKKMIEVLDFSFASPHPNISDASIREEEYNRINLPQNHSRSSEGSNSFLLQGDRDLPKEYIILHVRYPHYDIISPHTVNEFEEVVLGKSSPNLHRMPIYADAFEMYEQPTFQESMEVVKTEFPSIKDIVLISDSIGVVGHLIREYPHYRFHYLNVNLQASFPFAASVFERRGDTIVEVPSAPYLRSIASRLFLSIFTQFSLVQKAIGGVGMAFSHGSHILEKLFLAFGDSKPFYMVGKDDSFAQADDGFWFPPRLLYGRQPVSHGFEFLHFKYLRCWGHSSDLFRHIPTLRKYSAYPGTRVVLELGVRDTMSSWALAHGLVDQNLFPPQSSPPRHYAVDLVRSPLISVFAHHAKLTGIDYSFRQGSDLEVAIAETADLLFIDTLHVYGQLIRELRKFAPYTRRHILMHDTTVDGEHGEVARMQYNVEMMVIVTKLPAEELQRGLWPAVMDFLNSEISGGIHWRIKEHYVSNNGLTVLERIDNSSLIELSATSETQ